MKKLTVYAGNATVEVNVPPTLTTSKLSDVADGNAWKAHYTIGSPGAVGSIVSAWNGAAFDYATSTMHICSAGGHGDSWNNQCYALPIPGGPWRVTKPQTVWPPDTHHDTYQPVNRYAQTIPTAGNGYDQTGTYPVQPWVNNAQMYTDGAPMSKHVYGALVWLPIQQRVMLHAGSDFPGGSSDNYCGWFNPVDGTWTRKANCPRSEPGQCSDYDAVRNKVVYNVIGTEFVYVYDPAADTHTKIGPINTDPLSAGVGGPYCQAKVVGDYFYLTTQHGFTAYPNSIVRMKLGQPLSPLQRWEPVAFSGDSTAVFGNCPGMEYDPERNALVFWAVEDPGNVSILSLATFAVTKQPITAPVTTDTTRGVWGRFRRYAPNQYVLIVSSALSPSFITLA